MFDPKNIDPVSLELIKAVLNLVVAIAGLFLTWIVGTRVTRLFAERQKQRELELALVDSFYAHYGEFRSIWKQWNHLHTTARSGATYPTEKAKLLERACKAEGGMESALLKVCSERRLTADEQADLGNLRQGFQVLRESIQADESVSYGGSEHPAYLEFKRLATRFGTLIAAKHAAKPPTPQEAYAAFHEVTHLKHEERWKKARQDRATT